MGVGRGRPSHNQSEFSLDAALCLPVLSRRTDKSSSEVEEFSELRKLDTRREVRLRIHRRMIAGFREMITIYYTGTYVYTQRESTDRALAVAPS